MESKEESHMLSFLVNSPNIKITTKIDSYTNKDNNKCINQFEIIDNLGRGLMWKAYKVKRYYYDENKNIQFKFFALKKAHIRTLKQMRYYADDEVVDYFENVVNEIKIHDIMFNHTNIAKLFEVLYDPTSEKEYNLENEFIYLVMEYCSEGPIMIKNFTDMNYYHNYSLFSNFIKSEMIVSSQSENDASKIPYITNDIMYKDKLTVLRSVLPSIVKALRELHTNNIVYSDLKPENICILQDDDGLLSIKLLDFSISSIAKKDGKVYSKGGTVDFQAPEQFSSDINGYKADIWSLGVFIYVFLTNSLPFNGDSELDIQIKILKQDYKLPDYLTLEIANLLSGILTTADKRFTIEEIEEKIKSI